MKKIISIILLLSILLLSFVSCNGSDNATNNNDVGGVNINQDHNNVNGVCTVCNLNYFDVLRNIVLEKGRVKETIYSSDNEVELVVDDGHIVFTVLKNDPDRMSIRYYSYLSDYDSCSYLYVSFNRANLKYGEYNWSYNTDPYSYLNYKSISGTWIAADFKEITNTVEFIADKNVTNPNLYAGLVASYLNRIIKTGIPEVLSYGDYNKTAKHFGFRYFD